MSFDKSRLPDPLGYYESAGLTFRERKGKWRTTACEFHNGSDSMRVNTESGAFVCMNCGAKGGDVLAYHMAAQGLDFVQAAKALGAWADDGRPAPTRPAQFSAREGLSVLAAEANLIAYFAMELAVGVMPTETDRQRLLQAASRVAKIGGLTL